MPRSIPLQCALCTLAVGLAAGPAVAEPTLIDAEAAGPGSPSALDRAALERDDRDTRLWFWGWTAFYTGGAALEGALAWRADTRADRQQAALSAGGCVLGIGGLLIGEVWPGVDLPPPDAPALDVRRALVAQAEREEAAFGWFGHTANALVGIGGSLYLWLGLNRPGAALFNLPLSIGVGEAQIWTTPTHSLDRLRADDATRR